MNLTRKPYERSGRWTRISLMLLCGLAMLLPVVAFGQDGDLGGAQTKICGVMGNIHTLLKVASIVIVTVAIIFAGYQIAFAHKRISDVAPILIGGLLIGAASQIAVMIIGTSDGFKEKCDSGSAPSAYVLVEQNARNA